VAEKRFKRLEFFIKVACNAQNITLVLEIDLT